MSTAIATIHSAAADALAAALPFTAELTAEPHPDRNALLAENPIGMGAAFVGGVSADLVAFIRGAGDLALSASTDETRVNVADLYRPALEAAAAVLGTGVVGQIAKTSAADVLADEEAQLFRLVSAGETVGWFALRVREQGAPSGADVTGKLGRINDVEMALTVEIGRTRMSVRDVLNMEPGGVIELDRSAGAPADVLLNGRLIAHGEVVVVDQDFAVRITKILDVAESLS